MLMCCFTWVQAWTEKSFYTNYVCPLSIETISFYFFNHFIREQVANGFTLLYIVTNMRSRNLQQGRIHDDDITL